MGTYNFESADFLAVGRQVPETEMATNFMHMEHPSLSRRHAIILKNKCTKEIFLYDQGSTHGTTLNYTPVKAFEFHEVADGDILRFGESTRMVIVHIDEEEAENDGGNDSSDGGEVMQ